MKNRLPSKDTRATTEEFSAATGMRLVSLAVYLPGGTTLDLPLEQLQEFNPAGAVSYKDEQGKIHVLYGFPMRAVFEESMIARPLL